MRKPAIGQTAARTLVVTEAMLKLYAELTGDYNPLHFDDEFCKRTRFGERIAQGGITTGMINTLIAMELPGPGSVFMSQNYKFPNAAYVGNTLTATIEVIAVKPDKPVTQLKVHITRQDGALVLEGEAWVYTAQPEGTV
jgi:acyl dehydratase